MAMLWKWWKNRNDTMKEKLKMLVNEGRFEIVGGGWSMNDEATTNYQSLIDQYTWGFRRINDSFGSCGRPRVGWQVDPFGHSREQASIFARMGFDGMFVGRIDYVYKWARLWNKTAEFIWKGSDSLGKSANLFTMILYYRFFTPPGFCFDTFCGNRVPIIDDPNNVNYNVQDRVSENFPCHHLNVSSSNRPLVEEIHHVINNWVSQIIRIYSGSDHIEFDWLVGPVPVE
ncbi:lysosomal alpha-mannosidase-like [Copidosoma floridanum]|uniref:lysosomal alpha-mannosidase-like n=1 Tax=Copidosoma floridanum TaxID=29053 RepID=UPI000C6F989D|nr:lysosomal alpha-mannosidase-like [Copidosoma floridanum]